MSQGTARHDQHVRSEDEDQDVAFPQARPTEGGAGAHLRQPVGEPADDGGVNPDEPDEGEFGLIGDNDLGAADLGPAAPGARDPDAGSGRMRKITPDGGRGTGRG
jgi:hypothetical protein